jgi:hypothetical protein
MHRRDVIAVANEFKSLSIDPMPRSASDEMTMIVGTIERARFQPQHAAGNAIEDTRPARQHAIVDLVDAIEAAKTHRPARLPISGALSGGV